MVMEEFKLYKQIYDQVLDYADAEFISRLVRWGLNTHKLLKINGRLLETIDTQDNDSMFIYAASTAVIIGEFGRFAFGQGNYFPDGCEINLTSLDLELGDIKGYLNGYPDIDPSTIGGMYRGDYYIDLQDIWETIFEYNKDTHKNLYEHYKKQGGKDPNFEIYRSLIVAFDATMEGGFGGYNFVTEHFQY